MSWSIGYDEKWKRDIGYGVPSICDHPGCGVEINRGLSYVCGGEPYGGERGCGLYFCGKHLSVPFMQIASQLCAKCYPRIRKPFTPTPDTAEWVNWKLTDDSWDEWRKGNVDEVAALRAAQQPTKRAEGE